jgi:site-specific DNA recombinase
MLNREPVNMGDAMKAIGYIRVSTEDQAREGVSLDNQAEKIKAYAIVKDLDLLDVIVDAGISAKDLDRDGIQRVLKVLQAGKAEAVIVYKLDRLTRSTKDLLSLVYDLFIPNDIALHSINETLDTTTANGRFFITMLGGIATWERETISERTKDALGYKKTKKEWLGRVPFGFKIKDSRLIEDPGQMKVIQKAKRLRRAGKSIRDIAKRVDLSKSYVHKILDTNLKAVKALYCNGL